MVQKFYPYDTKKLNRIQTKIKKGIKLKSGETGLLKRISKMERRAKVQKKYRFKKHRR